MRSPTVFSFSSKQKPSLVLTIVLIEPYVFRQLSISENIVSAVIKLSEVLMRMECTEKKMHRQDIDHVCTLLVLVDIIVDIIVFPFKYTAVNCSHYFIKKKEIITVHCAI